MTHLIVNSFTGEIEFYGQSIKKAERERRGFQKAEGKVQ